MGFRLTVSKERRIFRGRPGDPVNITNISLGSALEFVVCLFNIRDRAPVQVIEFGPKGVTIQYPYHVSLLGDKPLVNPDALPGFSGNFFYNFQPLSEQDYNQLMEMIAAYLTAYPELCSEEVGAMMDRVKEALAA